MSDNTTDEVRHEVAIQTVAADKPPARNLLFRQQFST